MAGDLARVVTVWRSCTWVAAAALLSALPVAADVWSCKRPDGSTGFTDHPEPGCKWVPGSGDPSASQKPASPAAAPPGPHADAEHVPKKSDAEKLSFRVFPAATRALPSLLVSDLPEAMRAQGFSVPNRGDILIVTIRVSHLEDGGGPTVLVDGHFRPDAAAALRRAVLAAADGIKYDPRFLQVELTVPAAAMFDHGYRVDGPSAGVGWAVAVASSILGDPIRSDVCLTGTINELLEVGRVGGIEHKIDGCHKLGFRQLIIPDGQESFDLNIKRQTYGITITQVSTLADAYEAATGQPLRKTK
jgi:hypothetical protein